jgi:sporulation protein YpjB
MRLAISVIFAISLLTFTFDHTVHADKSLEYKHQLVELSNQILSLSKQREYEDALSILNHFSNKFLESDQAKQNLTMTELQLLTTQYSEVKESLTGVSVNDEDRIKEATEFHLLVDAIYSEHQPIWKSMKSQIITPIDKMNQALNDGNIEHFNHYFDQFLSKYEQVKPALQVDLNEERVNRLDSYLQFIEHYKTSLFDQPEKIAEHINIMKADFTTIFEQTNKNSTDLSIPWLIITIGGVIVSTLIYVGWIKYKAERQKLRKFN